jgi:hypothetical protein
MLDQNIVSVVIDRVAQDLEDRREAFGREVGQLWEEMNAKGALRSGATAKRTLAAISNEFRVRSTLIWYAFARAIGAKQIKLDGIIGSEVKKRLSDLLERNSCDLTEHYQRLKNLVSSSSLSRSISELSKAALERIYTEIDFAMLRNSESGEPSPGVVNIYQSYGIVQTGSGSSASLEIKIGGEERIEIEKALNAVKQVVECAELIGKSRRTEALELVSDVENEIERDRPNIFRIRSALQGLATSIQTIAAASQAYQLLKGVASFFGLQLP